MYLILLQEKIAEFQVESDGEKLKEWVDNIENYLEDFSNEKL